MDFTRETDRVMRIERSPSSPVWISFDRGRRGSGAIGLRPLSHHELGPHSVASQAVTGGHSIKAVQAQLGDQSEQSTHMYAHLGSGAQRRLVEARAPLAPPHVNHASTSKKKGT
jgi:integrase